MARDHPGNPQATEKWTLALKACFTRRLRPAEVEDALQECHDSSRISGIELAGILLRSGAQPESCCDPLLTAYISHFLRIYLLEPADILQALLGTSPYRPRPAGEDASSSKARISKAAQESIFALISSPYASGEYPRSADESTRTFRALLSYVQTYNAFETVQQIDNPGAQAPDVAMVAAYEHLGAFLVILLTNLKVRKHLIHAIPKGKHSAELRRAHNTNRIDRSQSQYHIITKPLCNNAFTMVSVADLPEAADDYESAPSSRPEP